MSSEYDPQALAVAAMKLAVASEGLERHRLIRFAQAWHEIARERHGRGQAPVTRQMTLPTSSATSNEPSGPSVTPTGRP